MDVRGDRLVRLPWYSPPIIHLLRMWAMICALVYLPQWPTVMENGHFLKLRWQNEQRSTIRQSKLNGLILKSIRHELLCQIETTSVIKKFAMAKSWKCHLKQWVRCLWQATSTHIWDHTVCRYSNDQKFGESGSINYCLCTVLVSCTAILLLGKKILLNVFGKKRDAHNVHHLLFETKIFGIQYA